MSKMQLVPFINFQGRARDAMQFYQHVLGGTLELHTANEKGERRPAGTGDRVTDGQLDADGLRIVATDGHPSYPATVGDHMALSLSGTDKARLTKIFSNLAEGGKVQMPLTKLAWGAEVGWLKDKFGVSWTVSIDGTPSF